MRRFEYISGLFCVRPGWEDFPIVCAFRGKAMEIMPQMAAGGD